MRAASGMQHRARGQPLICGGRGRGAVSSLPSGRVWVRPARGRMANLRGFTLLEMMLAVAIFALVSVLAFGGLNQVLRVDEASAAAQRELAALDVAFALVARDVAQIVALPPRDSLGDRQPEFVLERTRDGFEARWVRTGAGVDGLEYVGWRLDDEGLARLRFAVVDGADLGAPRVRVLLRHADAEGGSPSGGTREARERSNAELQVVGRDGARLTEWSREDWPAQLVLRWPSERFGVIERRFAWPERVSPAAQDADALSPAETDSGTNEQASDDDSSAVGDDALAPGEGGIEGPLRDDFRSRQPAR
ncbi:MAG: type II secretion system minor pseudopilin GspJ [Thioalkalivibrionaceae bacterium]